MMVWPLDRAASACAVLVFGLLALHYCDDVYAQNTDEVRLAPGWGQLSFAAPPPGTYSLPAIRAAAGGPVLNTAGQSLDLDDLLGEKITVLSFIYRTCDDVNGCPLSTMVSYKVSDQVKKQPLLKDNLRLLTLSFDPEFDTPEVMKEWGKELKSNSQADWQFLTSRSEQEIRPILTAYQQSVIKDDAASSNKRNTFSHILRVYLIDRRKQIRNIYNVSFLHPDILINDILTLLKEESKVEPATKHYAGSATENERPL